MTCGCISKDLSCRPSVSHDLHMHLVVARCMEPLDWLNKNEYSSVTIFEKCSQHSSNHQQQTYLNWKKSGYYNDFNTITDNIGREAHAYLHYIVQKYEHIHDEDLYIFVQGDVQSEIKFPPLSVGNISQTLNLLSHKTLFAQLSGLFTRIEKNTNLPWIEKNKEIHVLRGQFAVRGKSILRTNISSWKKYLKYSELHPAKSNYKNSQECAADCQFESVWNIMFNCRVPQECIPKSFIWGRHTYTSGILECYEA